MLLWFIMGLQNAVITKLSNAEIRTTHVTGIVTDIGIELGKLYYLNGKPFDGRLKVRSDRPRLRLLSLLALSFFVGGVAGALGFKYLGYASTMPLAIILISPASVPAYGDGPGDRD